MLEKLKIECGAPTVAKITKMFTDVDLSLELQREFKAKFPVQGLNFQVQAISQGCWHVAASPPVKIPRAMMECTDQFKKFYSKQYSNRRIDWLFNLGRAEVTPVFAAKPYQITVSVFQAAVLDQFNSGDSFSIEELQNATNIELAQLKPALLAMCNPKVKLLNKQIKKPTLDNPKEQISINLDFKNKDIKISV